jgi:hypothetical protein
MAAVHNKEATGWWGNRIAIALQLSLSKSVLQNLAAVKNHLPAIPSHFEKLKKIIVNQKNSAEIQLTCERNIKFLKI